MSVRRPCVLIFAGADPSGGAGIQADIQAVAALDAHPLTVITALTVQDNDHVSEVHPVAASLLEAQARALIDKIEINAVKVGIVANLPNAETIARLIAELRTCKPDLPVVFDPVLASGHGDALGTGDIVQALAPLIGTASLITPNLMEARALCGGEPDMDTQASALLRRGSRNVLIKGGHGPEDRQVENRWYHERNMGDGGREGGRIWRWPRLPGGFHGSGCTLASAIAALLASGHGMEEAIDKGQSFCQAALENAYSIAEGQKMPARTVSWTNEG